jgi:hypothetical protein
MKPGWAFQSFEKGELWNLLINIILQSWKPDLMLTLTYRFGAAFFYCHSKS